LNRVDYYVPGHCGSCEHSSNDCGSANQCEFCHAFLLLFGNASDKPRPQAKVAGAYPKIIFNNGNMIADRRRPLFWSGKFVFDTKLAEFASIEKWCSIGMPFH